MFSANDIIESYVARWNSNFSQLNFDPTRFVLDMVLNSGENILDNAQNHEISDALDHMTLNSMQAISGLNYLEGKRILKEFQPEKPGRITYETNTSDTHVTIDISDNGPGIDDKIIQTLFEYGTSTKSTQGSGLNDSRKGMEYLGGRLYVLDTNHKSTTFRIEIPK